MTTTLLATDAAERAVATGLSKACFAYRSFLAASDQALRTDAGWTDGFLALVERCAKSTVSELEACAATIKADDSMFPTEIKRLVQRLGQSWSQLAVVQNECGLRYVRPKLLTASQLDDLISERVESWLSGHGCSLDNDSDW